MYWRIMEMGAPPQLPAKYDGFFASAGVVLFADHAAGNSLEAVHQCRHGHGRRIIHQQMHMVILPVKLHQFRVEVLADGGEDAAQVGQPLAVNTPRRYLVTKTK